MNQRITEAMLQKKIDELNKVTGSPMVPYVWNEAEGRNVAQVGNWHVSGAYGGWQLHRMTNTSGGVTTSPLNTGYVSRRELFEKVCAFLSGLTFKE